MTSPNQVLKVLSLSLIFVVCAASSDEVEINAQAVEDLNYRLNDEVLPSHYKIEIKPYFENEGTKKAFTFDGAVEITLRATKANVREIILHAYDLEISSYSINGLPSIAYNASHYNEQYNKWTVPIPLAINGGILSNLIDTKLKIEYVGFMRDDMYGFYRSYYVENGRKVWMATTQFQPDHARRAFPCFDVRARQRADNTRIKI